MAGRKSSGTASLMFALGGKLMTEEGAAVTLRGTLALHSSCVVSRVGTAEHDPAVAAVVLAFERHLQAVQPGVDIAEAEQQQPERQREDAQSKLELQDSPGEYVTQLP